jgi:hypothetical protein
LTEGDLRSQKAGSQHAVYHFGSHNCPEHSCVIAASLAAFLTCMDAHVNRARAIVAETVVWNDPKISAINEVERTALQPSSFRPGNKASDLSSRSHPQIAWVASRWATCSPYLASPGPLTKPVEFVVLKFGEWDDGIIPSFPAHAAAQAKVPRTVQLLTSAAAGCRKNNFKTFRMGWMAGPVDL